MCAVSDPNIQKNDKSYLDLKEPLGNKQLEIQKHIDKITIGHHEYANITEQQ